MLDSLLKDKWEMSDAAIARHLGKSRSLPGKWRESVSCPDEDDLNRLAELVAALEGGANSTTILHEPPRRQHGDHPMEVLGRLGQAIDQAAADLAEARRHYGALKAMLSKSSQPASSAPLSEAARIVKKAAGEDVDR